MSAINGQGTGLIVVGVHSVSPRGTRVHSSPPISLIANPSHCRRMELPSPRDQPQRPRPLPGTFRFALSGTDYGPVGARFSRPNADNSH
jgi:hypothetical protein